jgi:uncharacterized protein (DUF1499 family)
MSWKLLLLALWPFCAATAQSMESQNMESRQLEPCPDSPNCVSSFDVEHDLMDSLPLTANGLDPLIDVIMSHPRTTIVTSEPDYIHVEYRSKWFCFADDVEFLADHENGLIHFRSASRLGRSDFGVNRERMEMIVQDYLNALALDHLQ